MRTVCMQICIWTYKHGFCNEIRSDIDINAWKLYEVRNFK